MRGCYLPEETEAQRSWAIIQGHTITSGARIRPQVHCSMWLWFSLYSCDCINQGNMGSNVNHVISRCKHMAHSQLQLSWHLRLSTKSPVMRGTVFPLFPSFQSLYHFLHRAFPNSITSSFTVTNFCTHGSPNCPASAFKNSNHWATTENYEESLVMGSENLHFKQAIRGKSDMHVLWEPVMVYGPAVLVPMKSWIEKYPGLHPRLIKLHSVFCNLHAGYSLRSTALCNLFGIKSVLDQQQQQHHPGTHRNQILGPHPRPTESKTVGA